MDGLGMARAGKGTGQNVAIVRSGIYLEQNRPRRSQFRVGRREPVRSVIVVHTAESGTDRVGPDTRAEGVAAFIRDRTSAGSYHLIGDADSIIQLVRFENEAFQDGTGSNRWAIGISLAMNAADWPGLADARRDQFTDTAGQMAAIAAGWLAERGLAVPEPRRLTKSQSDRSNASGFISHGRRDPARRTDPGPGFPWGAFFRSYQQHLSDGPIQPDRDALVRQLQRLVGVEADGIIGPITRLALNNNWLGRDEAFDSSVADTFTNNPLVIEWVQARLNSQPGTSLVIDGLFGPATEAAVKEFLKRGGVITAESFERLVEV